MPLHAQPVVLSAEEIALGKAKLFIQSERPEFLPGQSFDDFLRANDAWFRRSLRQTFLWSMGKLDLEFPSTHYVREDLELLTTRS